MDMKRTRILAGAVALAAGVAGFSADASAAVAVVGTMQGDQEMKNAAADAEEIRRVDAQTAAESAAAKAQMKDARVEAWEANRPEERKIDEEAKIADGKTIVDIVIDGAGKDTMATARGGRGERGGGVDVGK